MTTMPPVLCPSLSFGSVLEWDVIFRLENLSTFSHSRAILVSSCPCVLFLFPFSVPPLVRIPIEKRTWQNLGVPSASLDALTTTLVDNQKRMNPLNGDGPFRGNEPKIHLPWRMFTLPTIIAYSGEIFETSHSPQTTLLPSFSSSSHSFTTIFLAQISLLQRLYYTLPFK
jgi:hypothetical protein